MKFFTLMMSLYMLLLSCMPCNDSIDCTKDSSVSAKLHSSSLPEDHAEEKCTPFCVCACCAAPVFPSHAVLLIKKLPLNNPTKIFYEESFYGIRYARIWQPPRI